MKHIKLLFKIFRYKKTGRYFKFHELCEEDGYGEYQDSVEESNFIEELPTIFPINTDRNSLYSFTSFTDGENISDDEIEEVILEMNIRRGT